MQKLPDFSFEIPLWEDEWLVLGIDEVGRGAFAGPLVLSGVVFESCLDVRKKAVGITGS